VRHKIIAILLLSATIASAATLGRTQIDAIVTPAIQMRYCKGMVVGVIDTSGRQVHGYGLTDDGGHVPDGRTLFEIGSISKTFTTTLLAQMVTAGTLRLDQPVSDLLPPGTRVPEKDGIAITLAHLATHTAGLPKLPVNLDVDVSTIDNPYASYTTAMLLEGLARTTLEHKPGEQYEYSNFGVGLLGQALALKAGMRYEQLLVEKIARPLGMNDTRITLNANQKSRLAPGHIGEARVSNWEFTDALAGAGAIRSTADDMLIYLAANLGLIDTPLAPAIKLTHEPRAKVNDTMDVGLGWHIGKRTGARWHNGETLGYHSFVGFVSEKKIGVVVLSNSDSGTVDTLGSQLLWAALGNKVQPLPTTLPTTIPNTRTTSWASPKP
jgi:CubicO group peptidase (beta-lactamase class C family)